MRPVMLILCALLAACGREAPAGLLVIVSVEQEAAYPALGASLAAAPDADPPSPPPSTLLWNAAKACGLDRFTPEEVRGASRLVFASSADDARLLKCLGAEIPLPITVSWRREAR